MLNRKHKRCLKSIAIRDNASKCLNFKYFCSEVYIFHQILVYGPKSALNNIFRVFTLQNLRLFQMMNFLNLRLYSTISASLNSPSPGIGTKVKTTSPIKSSPFPIRPSITSHARCARMCMATRGWIRSARPLNMGLTITGYI